MKYILKYKTKSRYFGFVREYYKEFDTTFSIFHFIANNQILEWQVYMKKNCSFSDLMNRDIILPIGKQQDY